MLASVKAIAGMLTPVLIPTTLPQLPSSHLHTVIPPEL